MEGYNSKQKMYITIAVIIFIVINLIAVLLALPYLNKGNVKGIYTNSLYDSVLIEGNLDKDITLYADNELNTGSDSLFLKNVNYTLAALPQSKLRVNGTFIEAFGGIYYAEAINSLTIRHSKDINIHPNSKVFLDAGEGNVYILNGEIDIDGNIFYSGSVVNVNSDLSEYNILDKTQLLSTNKVAEMNAVLAKKLLFVEELNFNSIPKLEIFNNILEADSTISSYTIQGAVDAGSFLTIGKQKVLPDPEGNFSYSVDLQPGLNNIRVSVTDGVANTYSVYLRINFTE